MKHQQIYDRSRLKESSRIRFKTGNIGILQRAPFRTIDNPRIIILDMSCTCQLHSTSPPHHLFHKCNVSRSQYRYGQLFVTVVVTRNWCYQAVLIYSYPRRTPPLPASKGSTFPSPRPALSTLGAERKSLKTHPASPPCFHTHFVIDAPLIPRFCLQRYQIGTILLKSSAL
jgi:hypothetical protein